MLKHKQCVGVQCKDVCITCAKDESHGGNKVRKRGTQKELHKLAAAAPVYVLRDPL